jgi:opacity protein-like surface antigen
MKILKSLLLTTTVLAILGTSASAREGTYLGAQVGGSVAKAGKTTTTNTINWKSQGGSKSNNWGLTGGVFGTHEWISNSTVLGGTVAFDIENTKSKQSNPSGTYKESNVRRQYVVSLLGKAGYANFHKRLLPYVTAGAALTRFRYDLSIGNGTKDVNLSKTTIGWAGGAGLDYMINNTTDVGFQYLYTWYASNKKVLSTDNDVTKTTIFGPKAYHAATINFRIKI